MNKSIKMIGAITVTAYAGMKAIAYFTRESGSIDEGNSYLAADQGRNSTERKETVYERFVKPNVDSVLSFVGMIALLPVYALTAAAVYLDDPGPVLFSQKRIAKNKHYFMLHKFRTMKMDTPHDTPTHLLSNPDQYITRVGRLMRRYSIDELPQLWDCFRNRISLVGPRPALWNQADLVSERDKYGANTVNPGITGWAQINGRDELEIPVKAKLDGDYVSELKSGGIRAFLFDCRCLIGTVFCVTRGDGVVEGGTGELHRAEANRGSDPQ